MPSPRRMELAVPSPPPPAVAAAYRPLLMLLLSPCGLETDTAVQRMALLTATQRVAPVTTSKVELAAVALMGVVAAVSMVPVTSVRGETLARVAAARKGLEAGTFRKSTDSFAQTT
jgi:hypothetical protein